MSKTAKAVSLSIAVLLALFLPRGAFADNDPDDVDDYSDDVMNQRYDWVITCDTTPLKNYLNYPTSGLHPVSKVVVHYRLTPRFGRQRASYDPVFYEELWYHDCKPIGCRKVSQLNIENGQQGVIHFRPFKDMYSSHCAVANAAIRLLLDTSLKKAMLSCIIVPDEIFANVQSDLGQFGFFPYQIQPDTGIAATMHIFLQSQPSNYESSLYYFKGQY